MGFLAIDRLIERWNASGPTVKHQGEIYQATFKTASESTLKDQRICLVKPTTFMNLSGRCIGPLFHFYQCDPDDLIVIHDDLDLSPLSLRLKTGGGTGGHNGLKSIDESLGSALTNYHRIRIGIGHPSNSIQTQRIAVADYVLQPFSDIELKDLDFLLNDVADAIEQIFQGQIHQAMNRYHTQLKKE